MLLYDSLHVMILVLNIHVHVLVQYNMYYTPHTFKFTHVCTNRVHMVYTHVLCTTYYTVLYNIYSLLKGYSMIYYLYYYI